MFARHSLPSSSVVPEGEGEGEDEGEDEGEGEGEGEGGLPTVHHQCSYSIA